MLALTGVGAGCIDEAGPVQYTLSVEGVEVIDTESGWSGRFFVKISPGPNGRQYQNVTLYGYTQDGDKVCEKSIGTVTDEVQSVTVDCVHRPDMVTFSADVNLCDGSVGITLVTYDDELEAFVIDEYYRKCNEDLPPEPRTE